MKENFMRMSNMRNSVSSDFQTVRSGLKNEASVFF